MPTPAPLPSRIAASLLVGAAVTLAACGDSPQAPPQRLTLQLADPSGDHQTDTALASLAHPLRAVVRRGEEPVEGVTVIWQQPDPAFGFLSAQSSTTDRSGIAEIEFTLGASACDSHSDYLPLGYMVVAYLVPGPTASASFHATASPGKPAQLWRWDDYSHLGLANTGVVRYAVHAADGHGNRVGGVAIDWVVVGGRGEISSSRSITAGPAGGCGGPATALFTLGADSGIPDSVIATAAGVPGSRPVTFVTKPVSAVGHVLSEGFQEDTLTVSAGETVGWTWSTYACIGDGELCWATPHSVTFDDAPGPPASSPAQEEGTHTRMFATPGVYPFHCTVKHDVPHGGGVVVVR